MTGISKDIALTSLSLEIGSLTGDDKENIVLGFFSSEMMKKYAPSSYWTMFSLLKDYFIENSIPFDYDSVKRFFKVKEKGYAPKKAPAIEPENIKSYLMSNLLAKESYKKIVVICGYFGALRKSEIHALKKDDLTYNETTNNFTLRFIRIKTDKASIGQTVKLATPSNDPVSDDPVSDDPVSNDPVSNDPVSTDQMCEPVGKSDAPHNNKLSLNKTSNTTKYNSPTKIKGGITNSNKNVAITITGGSCNFYL
ncbi:hypothetical protein ACTFIY_010400 [Dictyostelium cf. discoideum]